MLKSIEFDGEVYKPQQVQGLIRRLIVAGFAVDVCADKTGYLVTLWPPGGGVNSIDNAKSIWDGVSAALQEYEKERKEKAS